MNPDELFKMPKADSIVFIKGYSPFYGQKFDIIKHPEYKTIDNNPTNIREKFYDKEIRYKILNIGG